MNQAQGAIDAARAAGAEQYAAADFTAAVDALKRADEAAAQRDYRLALNPALDSRERAQNAAKAAALARARARGNAERLVAEVATLLTQARARLSADAKVPRRAVQEQREIVDAVDTRLQEARTAITGDDYPAAVKAATGLAAQL
jgi:molybdopterin converting factor small subunit